MKLYLNFKYGCGSPIWSNVKFITIKVGIRSEVKLFLRLTKHHAMKTYGRMKVYLHTFLTLALHGGESASRLGRFTPGERVPGTHWIGGWVGPRSDIDAMAKRKKSLTAPSGNRAPVVQPVVGIG
jgi:hypothetical protein